MTTNILTWSVNWFCLVFVSACSKAFLQPIWQDMGLTWKLSTIVMVADDSRDGRNMVPVSTKEKTQKGKVAPVRLELRCAEKGRWCLICTLLSKNVLQVRTG